MTDVNRWHYQAMEFVDSGRRARKIGEHDKARAFYAQALEFERQAADEAKTQPSKAILYRSAAWIALEAEDPAESERLAACGLMAHDVPEKRKQELRAVAEEARMRLYTPMAPPSAVAAILIHMEGPAIAYGMAPPRIVETRKEALLNIVLRTAEREKGLSFRKGGKSSMEAYLQPVISQQAASVCVQIALMGGIQPDLWLQHERIVQQVQRCLAYVCNNNEIALADAIRDTVYRNDFKASATRLTPDGEQVSAVDVITSIRGDSQAPVRFREKIKYQPSPSDSSHTIVTGTLRAVDETKGKHKDSIKLVETNTNRVLIIKAPNISIEELTRSFYGRTLQIEVANRGKSLVMHGSPTPLYDLEDL